MVKQMGKEINETLWKNVCEQVNSCKALIKYTNCQWKYLRLIGRMCVNMLIISKR